MSRIFDLIGRCRLCYRLYFKRMSIQHMLHITKVASLRLFSKNRYPLSVLLGLTYDCQCKCVHCGLSLARFESSEGILSFSEIEDLISELANLGVAHITFTGGEPILRKDIFKIIKFASQKGLFTSLDSNGFVLNKENIKRLKRAGLTLVKISLDSSNPDVHDRIRSLGGCFDNAIMAMKNCVFEGLPCIISTVVTKEMVENRDLQNIKLLAKDIGVFGVKLEFAAYAGELLKREYQVLSEQEMGYVKSICDFRYIFYSSIFSNFSKCGCLSKLNCYISPTGDVQVCMFLPLKFGNIREYSFKSIWRKMYQHPIYRFSPSDCYGKDSRFRKKYFLDRYINFFETTIA